MENRVWGLTYHLLLLKNTYHKIESEVELYGTAVLSPDPVQNDEKLEQISRWQTRSAQSGSGDMSNNKDLLHQIVIHTAIEWFSNYNSALLRRLQVSIIQLEASVTTMYRMIILTARFCVNCLTQSPSSKHQSPWCIYRTGRRFNHSVT